MQRNVAIRCDIPFSLVSYYSRQDMIEQEKMKYNLKYLKEFSIWRDMKLMLMTVAAVLK